MKIEDYGWSVLLVTPSHSKNAVILPHQFTVETLLHYQPYDYYLRFRGMQMKGYKKRHSAFPHIYDIWVEYLYYWKAGYVGGEYR
jgi:hypothetical protein